MLQAKAFWDFSLALYSDKSVEQQCLLLQNRYDLNVNILLLCCFLDRCELRLSNSNIASMLNKISDNQERLRAFREKRLAKKNTSAYPTLLEQELDIEKQQQTMLIDELNSLNLTSGITDNIHAYIRYVFSDTCDELQNDLERFLQAINKRLTTLTKQKTSPLS